MLFLSSTNPGNGERRRVRLSRSRSAHSALPAVNGLARRAAQDFEQEAADRRLSQPRRFGRRDRARVGVGEKRVRALIRKMLRTTCRIRPRSSWPFRSAVLNEALLVAFSAISPTHLEAVDQMTKIVRELDRYGGAFAAEWRRSEPSRTDAPAEGTVAFGAALDLRRGIPPRPASAGRGLG